LPARATHRWTILAFVPNARATLLIDLPRRTAATIARRFCSTDFLIHCVSVLFAHHTVPGQNGIKRKTPGYGI
jgi:hypothetical protein